MAETVHDRVIAILAAQAFKDPDEVSPDMTLSALGIDSMGVVEVIYALEEAFDIQVPFNANAPDAPGFDVSTVGGIIAAVEGLVRDGAR
ncbi:MAG: acyl carrier protein [Pseudomonadota bacterium]